MWVPSCSNQWRFSKPSFGDEALFCFLSAAERIRTRDTSKKKATNKKERRQTCFFLKNVPCAAVIRVVARHATKQAPLSIVFCFFFVCRFLCVRRCSLTVADNDVPSAPFREKKKKKKEPASLPADQCDQCDESVADRRSSSSSSSLGPRQQRLEGPRRRQMMSDEPIGSLCYVIS